MASHWRTRCLEQVALGPAAGCPCCSASLRREPEVMVDALESCRRELQRRGRLATTPAKSPSTSPPPLPLASRLAAVAAGGSACRRSGSLGAVVRRLSFTRGPEGCPGSGGCAADGCLLETRSSTCASGGASLRSWSWCGQQRRRPIRIYGRLD
mmetsp:Transcript_17690/g.57413  ORF Transcript_17690/g.57413 Transcript_17690/m.57413 type:complete len:154 (-) Transcript_17690:148-609(-)